MTRAPRTGVARGRLSILIYHRVLAAPDPLQPEIVDAPRFARHMRWLRRAFRVLPLPDAVERLQRGDLPARAACITFDDGYADNAEVALPILQALGLPATFFIASGFLDGGRMWNDTVIESLRRWPDATLGLPQIDIEPLPMNSLGERRAALRRVLPAIKYLPPAQREETCAGLAAVVGEDRLPAPMMRSEQVAELAAAGMTIGAHTRSHPILTRVPASEAWLEIEGSRDDLEAITGAPVRCFAYPNGKPDRDYGPEHVALVRELGFRVAVSTAAGVAGPDSDPLQLPRFTPWDRGSARFMARLWHTRFTMPPAPAGAASTATEH